MKSLPLALVLSMLLESSSGAEPVFMMKSCGGRIELSGFLRLFYKQKSAEAGRSECTMRIAVDENERVLARVKALDLQAPLAGECAFDRLDLFDSNPLDKQLITPVGGLCGEDAKRLTFSTSGNELWVKFISSAGSSLRNSNAFEILLTKTTGDGSTCEGFRCCSGECIPSQFVRDSVLNCPDGSDEWEGPCPSPSGAALSVGGIGAVVVSVLFVIIITAVIGYIYCRRRRSRWEARQRAVPQGHKLSTNVGEGQVLEPSAPPYTGPPPPYTPEALPLTAQDIAHASSA